MQPSGDSHGGLCHGKEKKYIGGTLLWTLTLETELRG